MVKRSLIAVNTTDFGIAIEYRGEYRSRHFRRVDRRVHRSRRRHGRLAAIAQRPPGWPGPARSVVEPNDAAAERDGDGLGAVLGAELGHQVLEVDLDSFFAADDGAGDVAVAQAGGGEA